MILIEARDRVLQQPLHLRTREGPIVLRRARLRSGRRSTRVLRRRVELVLRLVLATGTLLDPVLAVIDLDLIQPRRELRLFPELLDVLAHGDEDLLCDVFCLGAIVEHAIPDVEDTISVRIEQLPERALVSVAQATE